MANLSKKYGKRADGTKYFKGYYAEFYDSCRAPKRKRLSLRTKDKRAAKLRLGKLERKYALGTFDPWRDEAIDDGLMLEEAVDRFLKSRADHCSEATIETYEFVLRPFSKSLAPGFPLRAVEGDHVEDFLNGKEIADATRRSYRDRLRIFFSWCEEKNLTERNPVSSPRRSKKSRRKDRPAFLSEEELNRLLRCAEEDAQEKKLSHGNRWLIDAAEFAVGTGLRRGELCHLKWSAMDLERGLMRVENSEDFTTKSGRERTVPIVGRAARIVRRRKAAGEAKGYVFSGATGGQLNGGYLSRRFRYYRRKAKLPEEINFHSLRHTFASWFVQRGGDLYRLKEILGHADMKTTLVYAHLRPEALREEMEKTFGETHEERRSELERLQQEIAALRNGGAVTPSASSVSQAA